MSRRKTTRKKLFIEEDPIYNSKLANMLINRILLKGKKTLAQRIFYEAMKKVEESLKQEPLEVLQKAIINITPLVELKARRVGGATYQIPLEIKSERGTSLALQFLIKSARKRPGRNIINKLGNEIIDAYNNIGGAIKKKEELQRMADANRAFVSIKL